MDYTECFTYLHIYIFRSVDDFTQCCAARAAKANVLCDIRHQDGLSNCDWLLKYVVLKYFIWILGILALVGNFAVILFRYNIDTISQKSDKLKGFRLYSYVYGPTCMKFTIISALQ